jgi:hypothetical protein
LLVDEGLGGLGEHQTIGLFGALLGIAGEVGVELALCAVVQDYGDVWVRGKVLWERKYWDTFEAY